MADQLNQDSYEKTISSSVPDTRIALVHAQSSPAPTTDGTNATRYTFILAGNKAGYESSTRNPDGSLQVHFEFNDRGRGPNINEKIRRRQRRHSGRN